MHLRPRVSLIRPLDRAAGGRSERSVYDDGSAVQVLLWQVAVDTQGSVENAEDIDRSAILDHVGDSVVPMKKDADVPLRLLPVTVA